MARNDKSALPGGTAMLVLALLKEQEMYGYQIIEELENCPRGIYGGALDYMDFPWHEILFLPE